MEEIKKIVKNIILEEFLPGEDPGELTDSVPLMTGGILDSIATLRLVRFLEDRFQIEMEAHEISADHLDSISDIAKLVHSKM